MKINAAATAVLAPVLPYVQDMKARQAAKAIAETRKADVARGAAAALSSSRINVAEAAKQQSKARLDQIREKLKVLKQLYANDPKQMARALAQVFKELKEAVKAYKAAGGQEMGMSNELAAGAVKPPAAEPKAEASEEAEKAEGEDAGDAAAEQSPGDPVEEPDPVAAQNGSALYAAVASEVRKRVGEDGLDFAKTVREMATKISELLETARTQARARKPDKDTDEALEEADKALKDLRDELADMERDIRMAAPDAGMKLEAAA